MNQIDFKSGMRFLAGAVTILSSNGTFGKGGITATAVSSVTDTPPTLLVCINRSTGFNEIVKQNQTFVVNVLNKDQQDLSNRFAGFENVSMEDRFLLGNWTAGQTGSPILTDSLVSFECKVSQSLEVGTHTVFFGEILNIFQETENQALLYFNRAYHSL